MMIITTKKKIRPITMKCASMSRTRIWIFYLVGRCLERADSAAHVSWDYPVQSAGGHGSLHHWNLSSVLTSSACSSPRGPWLWNPVHRQHCRDKLVKCSAMQWSLVHSRSMQGRVFFLLLFLEKTRNFMKKKIIWIFKIFFLIDIDSRQIWTICI